MDVDARVKALEEELMRVRGQLQRLEEALGVNFLAPLDWRLTPQEMRLFGGLLARPMLTKDAAMAVLYRDHGRDEPELKIIDVYVCKLRGKLKPFGIAIETVWAHGYRLSPDAKAEAQRQVHLAMVSAGVAA